MNDNSKADAKSFLKLSDEDKKMLKKIADRASKLGNRLGGFIPWGIGY